MVVSPISANCFVVREIGNNVETFKRMVDNMLARGIPVRVLDDSGAEKRFCID